MTPTIIQAGKYQIAAVRLRNQTWLGVREDPFQPWLLLSKPLDLGLLFTAISVAGTEWSKVVESPEDIENLSDMIVFDTRIKGASYRSSRVYSGFTPRDIFVGVGGSIPTLRIDSLDDANELAGVFWDMMQDSAIFENMVPVDADSSELSKGVDYGRAY